jgi:hypothetical protein
MGFNLRARRNRRPIDQIREHPECTGIRPSDLDGLSDGDLHNLLGIIKKTRMASVKTASDWGQWKAVGEGGLAGGFSEIYPHYRTTPAPQFGGEYRPGFGANDNHLSDDNDKEKSTKGEPEDQTPNLQKKRIDQVTNEARGPKFIVRVRMKNPSQEAAENLFNADDLIETYGSDSDSVYVVVVGQEKAMELARLHHDLKPIIEQKG